MATTKQVLKVRLDVEVYKRFKALFPGYGEASLRVQRLIEEYIDRETLRRVTQRLPSVEAEAVAQYRKANTKWEIVPD